MTTLLSDLLLRSIAIRRAFAWPDRFPYNVPVLASLERLDFTAPVTFLVGENGSGKSTLLEALACAAGSITAGSEETGRDETLDEVRKLSRDFKLTWSKRTRRGFFMRSEDFFGFARRMDRTRSEMQRNLEEVDREYKDRSILAQQMARSAYLGQMGAMEQRYGEGVDARSHGESYLRFFQARFTPGGLYLLDEPEAPLSPVRQLSFLVLLKSMIEQQSQFIIATHSPILMAFPGAEILSCDGGKITSIAYDEIEHVAITRTFLQNPQRYMRHLGILDE